MAVTVLAACVAVGVAALSVYVLRAPSQPLPDHADAIVVFAGASPRSAAGLRLGGRVADTVVLSDGYELRAEWCGQREPFVVLCPMPDPPTTRGEAELFARLAEARGWRTLVAVTSREHVRRAQRLLASCFDGDVTFLAVDSSKSLRRALPHEVGGYLDAFLRRDC